MDRWRWYLFRTHSEGTLRGWARRLRLFRFFRAHGGHAGDGDALEVAYRYRSLEDLERFFAFLGIEPRRYALEPPQPEPGVGYSHEEFRAFPSLIPGTRWIRQPGHCEIAGQKTFVWCHQDRVSISIHSGWDVTEDDVAAAEQVEPVLAGCPLEVVDPPADDRHYVCPKYYPELFA